MGLARRRASLLDELHLKYGFESILVGYPVFDKEAESEIHSGSDVSMAHPGWALVYWDDFSLLYLKRDGRYSSAAKEDEYRFIKPGNGIYSASRPNFMMQPIVII